MDERERPADIERLQPANPSDPQQQRVYCAQSLAVAMESPQARLTLEWARVLVADLTADLGVQSATVVSQPPTQELPSGLAQVDVDARVISVEAAEDGRVAHPLLIFHEVAHLVEPTLAEPHGPVFARTLLDLVDRYPSSSATYSHELRVCFRVYRVDVDPSSGRWARPQPSLDLALMAELERAESEIAALEVTARQAFMIGNNLGARCRELEGGVASGSEPFAGTE